MRAVKVENRMSPRTDSEALNAAYIHLTARRHTTASLARALGVSIATCSRLMKALRRKGHQIDSMKEGRDWYFAVQEDARIEVAWAKDPLLALVGSLPGPGRRGESVNDAVYGRK